MDRDGRKGRRRRVGVRKGTGAVIKGRMREKERKKEQTRRRRVRNLSSENRNALVWCGLHIPRARLQRSPKVQLSLLVRFQAQMSLGLRVLRPTPTIARTHPQQTDVDRPHGAPAIHLATLTLLAQGSSMHCIAPRATNRDHGVTVCVPPPPLGPKLGKKNCLSFSSFTHLHTSSTTSFVPLP